MVPKENNQSLFIDAANVRLKEINVFNETQLKFTEWIETVGRN